MSKYNKKNYDEIIQKIGGRTKGRARPCQIGYMNIL